MTHHSHSENRWADSDLETLAVCELCGGRSFTHQLDVPPWRLQRCNGCETVFTSPRLNERALNALYQEGYYEGSEEYFAGQSGPVTADQRNLAWEVRQLLHFRNDQLASLDVGCGGGQLVQAFAEDGFSAHGTEPSKAACDAAARLGRNVTNAGLASFADESFDCITALHVLEHVPHPKEFLREIARLTRPNGIVVVEVPNFGCRASQALGAKWLPLYPDTHLFHYTPFTLRQALSSAGIAPLRTRRLGGLGLLARPPGCDAANSPAARAAMSSGATATPPGFLGRIRSLCFGIPGVRRTVRWVAWELFGHGEYVRVIARKTGG